MCVGRPLRKFRYDNHTRINLLRIFSKIFRPKRGGLPRHRLRGGRGDRPPTRPRSGSDTSDHPLPSLTNGGWPTSTPSSTSSTPWPPGTILARANFSSASRGCRRCWPTSNGHASTPRRKRPPDRIDRLCETIEELTAERAARFSGPPSWEAGLRPPPPASNLVAAMSSAARQAQPPAEMIKNTVALTLVTPAMPAPGPGRKPH